MISIIIILGVLGSCMGSFVTALVWRLHKQAKKVESRKSKVESQNKKLQSGERVKRWALRHFDIQHSTNNQFSILTGRSMCESCQHQLAAKDLVPVLSWLSLGGKCRYCRAKISAECPIIELSTAALFVASYIWWPFEFDAAGYLRLGVWLVTLVLLVALFVYDWHWQFLPNKLTFIIVGLGVFQTLVLWLITKDASILWQAALGSLVGGGIFHLIFWISGGKYIGGGDVKLGYGYGLVLASPLLSWLVLTIASISGSLVAAFLLLTHKASRRSKIAFGPFLIVGVILAMIWGNSLLKALAL